jgi:hypothetical protein
MKKRTRVVAWIMLIYSAWVSVLLLLWALPYTHLLPHYIPSSMPKGVLRSILPVCMQLPLWIYLLKNQSWAWWGLTALYSVGALWMFCRIAYIPHYWLARGKTLGFVVPMVIYGLLFYSIFLCPLFFLLTDRPGGWRKVSEAEV